MRDVRPREHARAMRVVGWANGSVPWATVVRAMDLIERADASKLGFGVSAGARR